MRTFLQAIKASPITALLVFANLAWFAVSVVLDSRAFYSDSKTSFLTQWGANYPVFTLSGEYWRLLSGMFLHVNFLHLAVNMVALLSLGKIVERKLGAAWFLALYMLSGLVGSLLSAVTHRGELYLSCGASGAIMGLFGVAVVCAIRYPGQDGLTIKGLAINLALVFGIGLVANVDNMAHAGGMVTGLLMSVGLMLPGLSDKAKRHSTVLATLVVTAALVAGYARFYDRQMQVTLKAAKFNYFAHILDLKQDGSVIFEIDMAGDKIAGLIKDNAERKGLNPLTESPMVLDRYALAELTAMQDNYSLVPEIAQEYADCKTFMTDLQQTFSAPDEVAFAKQLFEYCDVRQHAFLTILGQTKTAFNPRRYVESGSRLEDPAHQKAWQRIARQSSELAEVATWDNSCQLSKCKRFR